MAHTLSANAILCGDDLIRFTDAKGRFSYVKRSEMDFETEQIYSNPEALAVFADSKQDYADGRFLDFDFDF